ncbi:MAG: amidohydrolase family protein [Myxococcota bacterium]
MRLLLLSTLVVALLPGCGHEFVSLPSSRPTLVIRGVAVLDAPGAALKPGVWDVEVKEGRIHALLPTGQGQGERVVEGAGATLLPGLIDLHTHCSGGSNPPWVSVLPDEKGNLTAFLYAGVTTVLDVGNLHPDIFTLRQQLREGRVLGPNLYAAGPLITTTGGHPLVLLDELMPSLLRWWLAPKLAAVVDAPEAARGVVEGIAVHKPDVLKIAVDELPAGATRVRADVIAAITAAGHAQGIRSVAHVGRSVDAVDAVRNGVDALVHGVYTEEISDEAVNVLAERKTPVALTISVFDAVARFAASTPPALSPLEREVAPPAVAEGLYPVPESYRENIMSGWIKTVAAAHAARRKNVQKMRAAGIPILVGTDSPNVGNFPGAAVHVEMQKMVEAGMTPGEVLKAATHDNARFLSGETADYGEVAPGKRADLLLVEGDPTADIHQTERIRAVIKDGVVLERHLRR